MDRRRFVLTSLAGSVVRPLAAGAQQAGKVARLGILSPTHSSVSLETPSWRGFYAGLRDLDWTLGRDLVLERRFAEGQLDRLPTLAQDLVRLNVDVIAAFGPLAIKPARDATRTIPILMIVVSDPIGQGLAATLARPGGNITGVAWGAGSEVVGKILESLKEALTRATKVAILAEGPGAPEADRAFDNAAQRVRRISDEI